MAYVDVDEIVDALGGVKKTFGPDGILAGRADTYESHPFLDSVVVLSQRQVDSELRRGGYVTPLSEPVTDVLLKSDTIGIIVGEATRALSSREPWMDAMEAAARAHLKRIGDGLESLDVEVLDSSSGYESLTDGALDETPQFDLGDPFSGVNEVFPSLGAGRYSRWRG